MTKWTVGMPVAYPTSGLMTTKPYIETTVAEVGKVQGTLANDQKFCLSNGKLVGRREFRCLLDMTLEANQRRVAEAKAYREKQDLRDARQRRLQILVNRLGKPPYRNLSDDLLGAVADAIETALGEVCDAP
jgi:hypothetical protein